MAEAIDVLDDWGAKNAGIAIGSIDERLYLLVTIAVLRTPDCNAVLRAVVAQHTAVRQIVADIQKCVVSQENRHGCRADVKLAEQLRKLSGEPVYIKQADGRMRTPAKDEYTLVLRDVNMHRAQNRRLAQQHVI